MAGAPYKQGLDFFSFDVDFFDDPKVFQLEEKHQEKGIIFLQRMWCFIYSHSHYLVFDHMAALQFRKKHHYTPEVFQEILSSIIELELFNNRLYQQYQVLTSESMQSRYLYATKRRQKVIYIKEFTLIDFDSLRSVPNDIEMWNTDGEFVEVIGKRTSKDKKKTKKLKPNKAADDVQKPVVKAAMPAPVPAATSPAPALKLFTHPQVLDYIKVPYTEHVDFSQALFSEEEYNDYVALNKRIDSRYDNIRISTRQLSFPEYVQVLEELTPTGNEMESALRKMSGTQINVTMDIRNRLEECIDMVRKPFTGSRGRAPDPPASPPVDINHPGYFRDAVLEKEVLEFFGFNEIKDPDKRTQFVEFITSLHNSDRLNTFRTQFKAYKEYIELIGINYRHLFHNYLGKQSDLFANGRWNAANWSDKLKAEQSKKLKSNGDGRDKHRKGTAPTVDYGKI